MIYTSRVYRCFGFHIIELTLLDLHVNPGETFNNNLCGADDNLKMMDSSISVKYEMFWKIISTRK